MNDEQLELASAYLDGEATAPDRARVEADPELVGLVEQLRSLRAATRATPSPDDALRDAAIAAALATAAAPSAQPAGRDRPSTAARRHRWHWSHGLGIAAAAVAVVVGGVTVLRDDVQAPTADDAAIDMAEPATSDAAAAPPAPMAAPAPTVTSPATTVAAALAEPQGADAPGVTASGDSEADAAAEAASAADAAPAGVEVPARLSTVTELASLVAALEVAPPLLADAVESCERGEGDLTTDAVYLDADGVSHDIAVVTLPDGRFGGLDVATCELVVQTPPPGTDTG